MCWNHISTSLWWISCLTRLLWIPWIILPDNGKRIPEWTISPQFPAPHTPFVTAGDTSSRIHLSWGQAPTWGDLTKPNQMPTISQSESLAGLPPWQDYFFPIWQPGDLAKGWLLVHSIELLCLRTALTLFFQPSCPLRNAAEPAVPARLLQPAHSAAGRLLRMLRGLDISYIWIFTSIMWIEHLCISSMGNDKAIWRLAPWTLPAFQKVENACSKIKIMLSRISPTAKYFYCPALTWDKCNFFFACLATDLHSSNLLSLCTYPDNPKKLGSENVIKSNCCWKKAVQYFQILGEKGGCLGGKSPYLCNHFWQAVFLFYLANSRECRMDIPLYHSIVVEWNIFFCNYYLISANGILFLISFKAIWGYFVRGK